MDAFYPQELPWRLWIPASELVSMIASTLRQTTLPKGLSASRAAAADGNWNKWADLYQDLALDPLLILYWDLVTILNTFMR